MVEHINELDCAMPEIEGIYPRMEHAVGLFLVQAIYHGETHRAEVCSVLGAHGLDVPDYSAWTYFLALRGQSSSD